MGLLSDKELEQLVPADQVDSGTPIPTRLVSSDGALTLSPIGHQANEGVVQRVFHAVFGGSGGAGTPSIDASRPAVNV